MTPDNSARMRSRRSPDVRCCCSSRCTWLVIPVGTIHVATCR